MNIYIFDVKFSNIDRLVQSNPIHASTYKNAVDALFCIPSVQAVTLMAVKYHNCWRNDVTEPEKYDNPDFGVQEPPNDPRIFNRIQADGTYRPLSEFFEVSD